MKIFYFYVALIFQTIVCTGQEMAKPESVQQILFAVNEVFLHARSERTVKTSDLELQVSTILNNIGTLEQQATFAVISWNLYHPGSAGDEIFDQWFEEAFWQAVERISKVKTKEGKETMESLKGRLFLDGGASLTFKNFAAQQNDMPLSEYDPSCSLEAIHNKRMMQRKLIEKKKKVTQKNKNKSGVDRGGINP